MNIKINAETPRPELIVKGIGFLCKRSYIEYEAARTDAIWAENLLTNMGVDYIVKKDGNCIVIYVNDYSAVKKRYDK